MKKQLVKSYAGLFIFVIVWLFMILIFQGCAVWEKEIIEIKYIPTENVIRSETPAISIKITKTINGTKGATDILKGNTTDATIPFR